MFPFGSFLSKKAFLPFKIQNMLQTVHNFSWLFIEAFDKAWSELLTLF